jgi:hypothetical protein
MKCLTTWAERVSNVSDKTSSNASHLCLLLGKNSSEPEAEPFSQNNPKHQVVGVLQPFLVQPRIAFISISHLN